MYLEKLEIQGFKSFANKTSLEFKREMTAVVGPNGSGKSNIADAVRWVLGEQSMKLLRGKKSEDVIFSGSDKKTQLGMAEVSLYLNNEDREAPIDYSQIVITRKIYRDGTGEYFINKNHVRLHDILLLLARSNFGQRAYSVIGQGMIDAVLVASPAERKQFFEEAAGIRQFQIKKEQAEAKLELTHENLKQANMLVAEIEPRLRSLTRQVHKLEQREVHEKRLRELQREYYSGLWAELVTKHRDVEKIMKDAESVKLTHEKEVAKANQTIEAFTSRKGRTETFAQFENEYQTLVDEKNSLLRDITILKGRADVIREQKGEMNLVWLERRKDQLTSQLRRSQTDLGQSQGRLNDIISRLAAKAKEQDQLMRVTSDLESDIAVIKKGLQADPSISALNIHGELKTLLAEQEDFLRGLESSKTPEEFQKLGQAAKNISAQLTRIIEKTRKLSAKDPDALLKVQEKLSESFKSQDALLREINALSSEKATVDEQRRSVEEKCATLKDDLASLDRDLAHLHGKDPQQVAEDQKKLEDQVKAVDQRISSVQHKLDTVGHEESSKQKELVEAQHTSRERQRMLDDATTKFHEVQIEFAKLETKKEDLDHEMMEELTDEDREAVYQSKHPAPLNESLEREIQKEKRNLELIGGIDAAVAGEYQETKHRYDFLTTQIADLTKAVADLEEAIETLDQTMKKQFDLAFEKINLEFSKYFKTLFQGGNAKLSLIKEEILPEPVEEELEEGEESEEKEETKKDQPISPIAKRRGEKVLTGVEINATPPGKRLRNIAMLSGGERALTSIALISAIISNNPSPFVILDEVDAALDESNSIRFAQIIERISAQTQFIAITHNRATMHKARILYGVTMGEDGVSRLLSVKMDEAEKVINKGTS